MRTGRNGRRIEFIPSLPAPPPEENREPGGVVPRRGDAVQRGKALCQKRGHGLLVGGEGAGLAALPGEGTAPLRSSPCPPPGQTGRHEGRGPCGKGPQPSRRLAEGGARREPGPACPPPRPSVLPQQRGGLGAGSRAGATPFCCCLKKSHCCRRQGRETGMPLLRSTGEGEAPSTALCPRTGGRSHAGTRGR